MLTYKLRNGDLVTSKDGTRPITYANRTQARKAASAIPGADVIVRGRPFYVRIPKAVAETAIVFDEHGHVFAGGAWEDITENPREKGDDDGVEYADPRDAMDEL